jgi:multiple sugar transport system substrate-binding protein
MREEATMTLRKAALSIACVVGLLAALLPGTADAQAPFVDVGTQPPIAILINPSPWYSGFERAVQLYEQQTRNRITMDLTPYGGVLEKARNAVREGTSPYDILNLDTAWTIEFYEGGYLTPLTTIDANFALPPEVLTFGDSNYWNGQRRWRTRDGGQLMGFSPNSNVHMLFYRADLLRQANLEPPRTWDDVAAICERLNRPPTIYGLATRGERGNGIRFDWMPFMLGAGANFVRDAENGDYTVTINSPEAKTALDRYVNLMRRCAPPNIGVLGQADVIQLMAAGRLAQALVVIAAWPSFEDRTRSAVVGQVNAAIVPAFPGRQPGIVIGNWVMTVPRNLPIERQRAALAFARWFLSAGAQRAYAEAGAIPVRSDIFTSALANRPEFRWMRAYVDSQPLAQQVLGFAEGAQVEQAIGLRLNQALIGEISSNRALNLAAREIEEIFQRNGRRTGHLEPLPE